MEISDVFEGVGAALRATAEAAKDVDWETVGKVTGAVAGVGAVGAVAYYVGTEVGHTDGAKDGYVKASKEYASKFADQERRIREEAQASESKINAILKGLSETSDETNQTSTWKNQELQRLASQENILQEILKRESETFDVDDDAEVNKKKKAALIQDVKKVLEIYNAIKSRLDEVNKSNQVLDIDWQIVSEGLCDAVIYYLKYHRYSPVALGNQWHIAFGIILIVNEMSKCGGSLNAVVSELVRAIESKGELRSGNTIPVWERDWVARDWELEFKCRNLCELAKKCVLSRTIHDVDAELLRIIDDAQDCSVKDRFQPISVPPNAIGYLKNMGTIIRDNISCLRHFQSTLCERATLLLDVEQKYKRNVMEYIKA